MQQATSAQRALHPSFPVVGIATSTGGSRALEHFFAAMPPANGMVFIVMPQPAADDGHQLAKALRAVTAMPVHELTEPVHLVRETVYVVPSAHLLRFSEDLIEPVGLEESDTNGPAPNLIDRLFRALAEAYATRTAGIVLSGDGTDGALGIAQVRELGGIIFAQDPQEAEHPAMPRNVINSGASDVVLPVAAMPEYLLTIWPPESLRDERQASEAPLYAILATVHDRTGYDFSPYDRQVMMRRLERRRLITLQADLATYQMYLTTHQEEAHLLRNDLLVSVTCFFRNQAAYEALARTVVPLLFAGKQAGDTIRVWVAGCASGEEAYSLAIVLLEHAATIPDPPGIQIFASDVNEAALEIAREGCYPEAIAIDVAPDRLRRFFRREKEGYRIAPAVRDCVVFAQHNLIVDTPFVRLDLVSCRNVLSYLNQAAQERVVHHFQFALRSGGCLFLGRMETPDALYARFAPLDLAHNLFRAETLVALPQETAQPPAHQQIVSTTFNRVHLQLLQRYRSASILVNTAFELVHLSDNAGRFLRLSDGTHSFHLFTLIRPELHDDLRLALIQAEQTNQSVESRRIRLEHDAYDEFVSIRVYPERDPKTHVWFALIFFDVVERIFGAETASGTVDETRLHGLEADLVQLYEELSATSDPVAKALRASNEALYASNEELRVMAEELETSKEALEAVNEELQIVNQELGYRVDELSTINDDLTNLIEATHIAIVFLDPKLHVTRFTPEAARIFNLLYSDVGRPLAHITHHLDYADLLTDAEGVLQTAEPIEREVESRAGQTFLVRIGPYHTTRRWNAGVVLRFIDITDRKSGEAKLASAYLAEQQARVTAEGALFTRDQFLSIASHELRTPMTALLGYAQLLRKALHSGRGDMVKMADRVIRQTQRLDSLVDQLLDVSRLQRGRFALERRPLDLHALGVRVVDEFRETLPAAGAQAVHFVAEADPAPIMVYADPSRIEQVMLNLLSNAVKYSQPKSVVQLRLGRTATEATLEVIDQGIGVPEHVQNQIFQAFFRAENVDMQVSGFGLGLYIVQNIVERHEGTITLASAEGAGSTFLIRLPLLTADQEHADSRAELDEA